MNKKCQEFCSENKTLKYRLQEQEDLLLNLKNKLVGTNAVVYSVQNDRQGKDTFICVNDNRKFNEERLSLEGELNIYALSSIMNPSKISGKYNDMPYLQSTFYSDHIILEELHSDVSGNSYEKQGYGTMLLDTLIEIARRGKYIMITGTLSRVDAKTEEEKNNRNNFYRNYKKAKAEVFFADETERDGHFIIKLE